MDDKDGYTYAADQELLDQFLGWTAEAVDELKALAEGLDGSETKSHESIARIYDLTHNIKGMGASFEYTLMTNVGHSLCGYIKDCADNEPCSPRVLQAHIRVFQVVLENSIQGDGGDKGAAIEKRLAAIIAGEG